MSCELAHALRFRLKHKTQENFRGVSFMTYPIVLKQRLNLILPQRRPTSLGM